MRPLSVAYSSASIPPAGMDLANEQEGFPRNKKRQRLGTHGVSMTGAISAKEAAAEEKRQQREQQHRGQQAQQHQNWNRRQYAGFVEFKRRRAEERQKLEEERQQREQKQLGAHSL